MGNTTQKFEDPDQNIKNVSQPLKMSYFSPEKSDQSYYETKQQQYSLSSIEKTSKQANRNSKQKEENEEEANVKTVVEKYTKYRNMDELELMKHLPALEPLIRSNMGYFTAPNVDSLSVRVLFTMCAGYKELLLKQSANIDVHQRELAAKIYSVEKEANEVLESYKRTSKQLYRLEKHMKEVDTIFVGIDAVNRQLEDIVNDIEVLCFFLPNDERVTQVMPTPILQLTRDPKYTSTGVSRVSVLSPSKVIDKNKVLVREGILPSTRAVAWKRAIGNELHITKEKFLLMKQQAELKYDQCQADKSVDPEFFGLSRTIRVDVPRTFPSLEICENPNTFTKDLTEILETYIIFRPAVGYAQGMSYMAGMLLLQMNQFDSFVSLANLLETHFFASLFKMDLPELRKHLGIYDLMFSEQLPLLYERFKSLEVMPEQYLLSWISTGFSKILPLSISTKLWDAFLLNGEIFLYKSSLGLLRVLQPQLLRMDFEETVSLLKNLPSVDQVLFDSIETIEVKPYVYRFLQRISKDLPPRISPLSE